MVVGVKINPNDGFVQVVATGGQTDLDFDFPLYDDDHITIIRNRGGVITTLTKTTDYTIAPSELEVEAGGTAVLTTGATNGDIYTLLLSVPEARDTDYNNAGDFDSDTLNRELDLQVQMIQQLRRDTDKSLKFADSSSTTGKTVPEPSDGKVLGWDGTSLVNLTRLDEYPVSPFMETVLDDVNGDAVRVTCGFGNIVYYQYVDEDNMASDSNSLIPSQQSVKAYHDTRNSGWTSGTLTLGALSGAVSNATGTIFWRRVGKQMQVRGQVTFSGASSAFTALTIDVPNGQTIDTSAYTFEASFTELGRLTCNDSSTTEYPGHVVYRNTTSVHCRVFNAAGTYLTSVPLQEIVPFTFGSGDKINFDFEVPIVGW